MPKFNPDIHGTTTDEYKQLAAWLEKHHARYMWIGFAENGPTTHGYVVHGVLVIVTLYRPNGYAPGKRQGSGWDIYIPSAPNTNNIEETLALVEKALDIKPGYNRDQREIKGNTQPLKIGASLPVGTIRAAYLDSLIEAIRTGREIFGDTITDAQIVAIARGEATLRGWTPNITYHSEPCQTCRGQSHAGGEDCLTCRGDGFAPPFGEQG